MINLSRLAGLFHKAGANLKTPRVRFSCSAGEFTVAKAPEGGKNPGCLYVKQGSEYLGKVLPDGRFFEARGIDGTAITRALAAFAADPAKAAAAYGHETGSCCFCGLTLTDERSVSVGYGPICAGHYGLPWGEVEEVQPIAAKIANIDATLDHILDGRRPVEVKPDLAMDIVAGRVIAETVREPKPMVYADTVAPADRTWMANLKDVILPLTPVASGDKPAGEVSLASLADAILVLTGEVMTLRSRVAELEKKQGRR